VTVRPPIICVVGKKKSGKTTTVVGLVRELVDRGYCVMTAKHGHNFELDTAGTDSWRHRREAGASRVVLASPERVAVMGDWDDGGEQELEQLVSAYLSDADIVVAEGFRSSSADRIEVFREVAHERPYYGCDPNADERCLAVLTDTSAFDAAVPIIDVDAPDRFQRVADLVEARFFGSVRHRDGDARPGRAYAVTAPGRSP